MALVLFVEGAGGTSSGHGINALLFEGAARKFNQSFQDEQTTHCSSILNGRPESQNVQLLEPVNLSFRSSQGEQKLYDEGWIQNLIHNNPSILPVGELEPAFFPLYPVCRELKTSAGYLDNLFVSENGSLTLVECKLWRNPEARSCRASP